jgi:hypothetical protein
MVRFLPALTFCSRLRCLCSYYIHRRSAMLAPDFVIAWRMAGCRGLPPYATFTWIAGELCTVASVRGRFLCRRATLLPCVLWLFTGTERDTLPFASRCGRHKYYHACRFCLCTVPASQHDLHSLQVLVLSVVYCAVTPAHLVLAGRCSLYSSAVISAR